MSSQRSERAVRALASADPQFSELCKMLYGEAVDPEVIWEDVFAKRAQPLTPEQRRERTETRIARASNALGLTAGAAAIAPSFRDKRNAGTKIGRGLLRTGKILPEMPKKFAEKHAARLALGGAALQVSNVAGDIVTSRVLGRSDKKSGKQVPVDKAFKMPKVGELAGGLMNSMRQQLPANLTQPLSSPRLKNAPKLGMNKPVTEGQHRRAAKVGNFMAGRGGAVVGGTAIGGTAIAGGGMVMNRKAQNNEAGQDFGYPYDPVTYGKSAEVSWEGEFSKFDEDKRLAFGWASVVSKNGVPVVDRQGDLIDADEIEKAAYDYVLKSRVGGDMHRRNGDQPHKVSELVESFVVTPEKIEKMGLPPDTPVGWWVGFKIQDDEAWQMVKKGERTGFSIHGKGKRVEKSYDEAMGY